MHYKRILLILIVMIFMTGTLSAEAATTGKAVALEPWTNGVVDKITGGYVGSHVSIAHYERDGSAYVSYYDATNKNLKLAYQISSGTGNCPGDANWKCETVDNGFISIFANHDVGQYNSIDVVDETYLGRFHYARIGISYYDATAKALKFAERKCTLLDCSWTITTVHDDGSNLTDMGQYSSFKFAGGTTPTIFYHLESMITTTGMVKRAVLTGDNSGPCAPGWLCDTVAYGVASSAYGTHISADGGRVVFYDPQKTELVMAHSTGSALTNTCGLGNYWDCEVIDSNGDVGKFASFSNNGGHPMKIAYYDATNGKVKYAISVTSGTGNCTNANFNCFAVDTIGVLGTNAHIGISLTQDAKGEPVIAYQHFLEDAPAKLKLARPAHVYGEMVGNCGGTNPDYLFTYWQCSTLDWGGQYQNEGDYTAVSISPAGLATVAYYEIFESAQDVFEGRLKVAQQHFAIYLPLISK
jgi:hypothetical protein